MPKKTTNKQKNLPPKKTTKETQPSKNSLVDFAYTQCY